MRWEKEKEQDFREKVMARSCGGREGGSVGVAIINKTNEVLLKSLHVIS